MSLTEDPIYRDLAVLLHEAWSRIDWKKISTSWKRRGTDIFQHRLKKAAYSGGINQVIERLCKGLSLQSLNVPIELIERLKRNEVHTMRILRTQSVVLTLLAKTGPEALDKLKEESKK